MSTQYDPQVLQTFADMLYAQARRLVITGAILGALVVGGVALVAAKSGVAGIIGALVGVLIGMALGQSRAFALRLQAQTALCQLSIEKNTRRDIRAA